MLLQTNSYLVPRDRLRAHDLLMSRFRQCFERMGLPSSDFDVFRQAGEGFTSDRTTPGVRCVQMMRFRDRDHFNTVRQTEEGDAEAKRLVDELCRLVDLPAQQRTGHFGGAFYTAAPLEQSTTLAPAKPAHTDGSQEAEEEVAV